ncbi:MAG: GNAT family N-acetyltransferase [Ferruginibacter sp.]
MKAVVKNNRQIELALLNASMLRELCIYLAGLTDETVKRFGPHPFDPEAVRELYAATGLYTGYVAFDDDSRKIIAYAIVKTGYLPHDAVRLSAYGLQLSETTDCTLAPSVADAWQGMGLGDQLLQFIYTDLKQKGFKRMILWGGVQASNEAACRFYLKNGFTILGQFSYNGENFDMTLQIN